MAVYLTEDEEAESLSGRDLASFPFSMLECLHPCGPRCHSHLQEMNMSRRGKRKEEEERRGEDCMVLTLAC